MAKTKEQLIKEAKKKAQALKLKKAQESKKGSRQKRGDGSDKSSR